MYINKVKILLALCYRPPDKHISEESLSQFLTGLQGEEILIPIAHFGETKTCASKEESV
jgi:hypothetical protein